MVRGPLCAWFRHWRGVRVHVLAVVLEDVCYVFVVCVRACVAAWHVPRGLSA